jgi:Xaa-Pro dipeptidase
VRPGTLCEEVEAAFRKATLKRGYEKKARVGYAEGLCFQPTWIERTMSFQRGDRTPLQRNMTFHLHGGMWAGRHSVMLTESIAVTQTGCEQLTHYPRKLLVKET